MNCCWDQTLIQNILFFKLSLLFCTLHNYPHSNPHLWALIACVIESRCLSWRLERSCLASGEMNIVCYHPHLLFVIIVMLCIACIHEWNAMWVDRLSDWLLYADKCEIIERRPGQQEGTYEYYVHYTECMYLTHYFFNYHTFDVWQMWHIFWFLKTTFFLGGFTILHCTT